MATDEPSLAGKFKRLVTNDKDASFVNYFMTECAFVLTAGTVSFLLKDANLDELFSAYAEDTNMKAKTATRSRGRAPAQTPPTASHRSSPSS